MQQVCTSEKVEYSNLQAGYFEQANQAGWWHAQDYVMERLQRIEGVRVAAPDGAFYVLPDLSAFFGPDVHADDFGPIPDADTLCRYHRLHHLLLPVDSAFMISDTLKTHLWSLGSACMCHVDVLV